MSTKSHILYDLKTDIEIYHETSEPVSIWGVDKGYNIYCLIPIILIDEWRIKGDHIYIDLKKENNVFPEKIKFWGGWLDKVSSDNEHLCIIIRGGSKYDEKLSNKEFSFFDVNDHKLF